MGSNGLANDKDASEIIDDEEKSKEERQIC